MIPGRNKPFKRKHFAEEGGLSCMVVGCIRRARHQWAYPCAVTTLSDDPAKPVWMVVCDECDVALNETLLRAVGVPEHVLRDLMNAYRQIQADASFDS